jgi:hypothetical protein
MQASQKHEVSEACFKQYVQFAIWVSNERHYSPSCSSKPLFILRSTVFWVVTPCSSEKASRFGRTCHLYLQGRTVNQAGRALFAACFCRFLVWLILRLWRWRRCVPPKRQALSERHDGTNPKIVLVIVTAERTSNPAMFRLCNQNVTVVSKANRRTVTHFVAYPKYQKIKNWL